MIIKHGPKVSNYCNLRLFDKTTLSFIGNQRFTYRKYVSLCRFADQYASFTCHRVAIVGVERNDYKNGSWRWTEIF